MRGVLGAGPLHYTPRSGPEPWSRESTPLACSSIERPFFRNGRFCAAERRVAGRRTVRPRTTRSGSRVRRVRRRTGWLAGPRGERVPGRQRARRIHLAPGDANDIAATVMQTMDQPRRRRHRHGCCRRLHHWSCRENRHLNTPASAKCLAAGDQGIANARGKRVEVTAFRRRFRSSGQGAHGRGRNRWLPRPATRLRPSRWPCRQRREQRRC